MIKPKLIGNVIGTTDGLGIYIPDIKAICIADLHLGIEHALFSEGTYLPIDQYRLIEDRITSYLLDYKAKTLIINGDFKHEFSRASKQEWFELGALVELTNRFDVQLEIVRGNHDNYLKSVLTKQNRSIRDSYLKVNGYIFMHGHQSFDEVFEDSRLPPDVELLVLAHEHPAIILYDDVKGKHTFKCYLLGKFKDIDVLVLPAFSPFTNGSMLNDARNTKILSPTLKIANINDFRPIVIDNGEVLEFPKLNEMRTYQSD
jgi:putative SbcD/Mre11-related phosphoesterase